jgi:UDP-glucose 4-epimerase
VTPETVLVTGASGFLGARLMARLRAAGQKPIGVGRRPPASAGEPWNVCDLLEPGAIERLFAETRPAAVFHLASEVHGTRDLSAVLPTFRANLATTVEVLAAAAQRGCRRVVLAASLEELPLEQPARFPYAIAKRTATEYGRFFQGLYGLPVVSARIGMAYGPGQRDTAKLVPHVILSQLASRAPKLASGERRADWVYVDDVADALIACMQGPVLEQSVVDVGTGVGTSVGEIAERLTRLTGGPAPERGALPDRAQDRTVLADVDAAARLIGWRATHALDDGLRRTVDWYRQERTAGRL